MSTRTNRFGEYNFKTTGAIGTLGVPSISEGIGETLRKINWGAVKMIVGGIAAICVAAWVLYHF